MDADTAQDWESPPEAAPAEEAPAATSETDAEKPAETQPAETGETTEEPTEEVSIEEQRKALEEERKALNREAYEVRQLKKKLKEKETSAPADIELTDAQFEALLVEHQGDAKMQTQIMKQMARQIARGEKVDAVKTVERQQILKQQEAFLAQSFPDIAKDDSQVRRDVDQVRSILGLDDRPDADFLAMASIVLARMPQLVQEAEERGRQSALKGKVEAQRKAAIKGSQSPQAHPGQKDGQPDATNNYGLTAQQMETARKNFKFSRPEQFKWYAANLKATAGNAARA